MRDFRAGRDLVDGGSARGTAWAADYDLDRCHQRGDAFDPAWDLAAAAPEERPPAASRGASRTAGRGRRGAGVSRRTMPSPARKPARKRE